MWGPKGLLELSESGGSVNRAFRLKLLVGRSRRIALLEWSVFLHIGFRKNNLEVWHKFAKERIFDQRDLFPSEPWVMKKEKTEYINVYKWTGTTGYTSSLKMNKQKPMRSSSCPSYLEPHQLVLTMPGCCRWVIPAEDLAKWRGLDIWPNKQKNPQQKSYSTWKIVMCQAASHCIHLLFLVPS